MPRPKTKEELLKLSLENFDKLNKYIDQFRPEERLTEFAPGTMNRNIRDVLAHLHHWHLLLLGWYEVGMTGAKPDMPAKGYTWKTTSALNRGIWEKYSHTDLREIYEMLQSSFKMVREVIERHSNEELFEKKRYKWTGTTSLGSYLVSCTSSHYDWALKLIKKGMKPT